VLLPGLPFAPPPPLLRPLLPAGIAAAPLRAAAAALASPRLRLPSADEQRVLSVGATRSEAAAHARATLALLEGGGCVRSAPPAA